MLRKGWAMSGIPLETADDTFKLATNPDPPKVSLLLLAVVLASDLALLLATSQGKYFVGNRLTAPVGGARPREDQERLWEILEGMCRDL